LQRAALSIQATAVWLAEHKFLSREEMQQYKNLVSSRIKSAKQLASSAHCDAAAAAAAAAADAAAAAAARTPIQHGCTAIHNVTLCLQSHL